MNNQYINSKKTVVGRLLLVNIFHNMYDLLRNKCSPWDNAHLFKNALNTYCLTTFSLQSEFQENTAT
jgi:hypothetical protein